MRKFLIVFGLFVIACGVGLAVVALVTAEDQSQQWQNNVGKSTCVVEPNTAGGPPVERCDFNIRTPYQAEMPLLGLTLALTGIGIEVAALALGTKPPAPIQYPPVQYPPNPNFGPPPVSARAG